MQRCEHRFPSNRREHSAFDFVTDLIFKRSSSDCVGGLLVMRRIIFLDLSYGDLWTGYIAGNIRPGDQMMNRSSATSFSCCVICSFARWSRHSLSPAGNAILSPRQPPLHMGDINHRVRVLTEEKWRNTMQRAVIL